MRCNCKGQFKEEIRDFEWLQSEVLVCQKCGYVTLTMKQAGKLLKLKVSRDSLSGLLKAVTKANRHTEYDWGKIAGLEVW